MDAVRLRSHSLVRALMFALMAAVLGCGDDGSKDDPVGPLGIDDGASNGVAKSALVRGDRDVTVNLRTGAGVFLPAGAVSKEVNVTVRRPKDSEALPLVASLGRDRKIASAPYVLTPHGETFTKDVRVALPIAAASAGKQLTVAWLENESDTRWKVLGPGTVAGNQVVAAVKHFSVVILVEGQLGDGPIDGGVDGGLPGEGGTGTEAGTQADGGVIYPEGGAGIDGGVQPGIDATVRADAASDATGPVSDAAVVDYQAELLKRFQECKMIGRTGQFSFPYVQRKPEDTCYLNCLTTVPCADLQSEWCRISTTDPLVQCFARCLSFPTVSCVREDGEGLALFCDARQECLRGEDEVSCEVTTDFDCSDGSRIPLTSRCDGHEDCEAGEDELRCVYPANFFTCADGTRLPPEFECDGELDCPNGEDERNCQNKLFRCTDGSGTYNINRVCNTFIDCRDGSDEPANCTTVLCPDF